MKKILMTLCMALTAVAMMAQQPVITFEKTEHDFGKINEADGRVSTVFTFKNEGMSPLVLSNVRASCGCTTPTWTKEPVEPGQTGTITVTYNPNGRPGRFQKTVTITSNATDATKKVYIKGEVIPKQAKPSDKMRVAVGDLRMKATTLDLGTILKGETGKGELEYTNVAKEDHSVELAVNPADAFLINQVTLSPVKTEQVGKFVFAMDTKKTKLYGPVVVNAYVVIDGKKELSEDYRLTIAANIEEDFSQMTQEDRMQAPIMEADAEIDLGTIVSGKTLKRNFAIKNSGVNPLEIRRVYSNDEKMNVKPCKAVKSGKKGNIAIEIKTDGKMPGKYTREMVIISNDYKQPNKKVNVSWTIE
ncbi:MAG: DUF1573 domain-containing protein [Paludibacteraceae bacterium]|nr:DUF1573 domain-containing protein [Paludibacteraceae bacterium]